MTADQIRARTLATASEIARDLNVSCRTVYGWMERYPNYPAPVSRIGNARVWDLDAVREWHRDANLRVGRPPTVR